MNFSLVELHESSINREAGKKNQARLDAPLDESHREDMRIAKENGAKFFAGICFFRLIRPQLGPEPIFMVA